MIGWRAKIGLIVPGNNSIVEPEFWRAAPEGVSFHSSRILVKGVSDEEVEDMFSHVDRATAELVNTKVDAIAYCDLASTLIRGLGWDAKLRQMIEEKGKVPVAIPGTAMLEGLREFSIRKVAVVSPYPPNLQQALEKFLTGNGFQVVASKALNLDLYETPQQPSYVAYRTGKEICTPEADGLFIASTDFRAMDVIEKLEMDLNKPVVSVNQATLWKVLQLARIKESVKGFGRLLAKTD